MPFQFVIDTEANVIRETWTGVVDMAQLKDSCRQEWAHPDYRKDLHMISDFRQATVKLTAGEVWTFVSWFGQNESLTKLALIVSREVGFGLARMFTSISEGTSQMSDSIRIFHDYEAAERWIAEEPEVAKAV